MELLQYFSLNIQMFDDFDHLSQVLILLNDRIVYIEYNHQVNDGLILMLHQMIVISIPMKFLFAKNISLIK